MNVSFRTLAPIVLLCALPLPALAAVRIPPAQLLRGRGLPVSDRPGYPLLELSAPPEQPRVRVVHQAPELLQPVLHRGAGERDPVAGPQAAGGPLTSTGLLIVNPPWTLAGELKTILPELEKPLGQGGASRFRLETPKP